MQVPEAIPGLSQGEPQTGRRREGGGQHRLVVRGCRRRRGWQQGSQDDQFLDQVEIRGGQ